MMRHDPPISRTVRGRDRLQHDLGTTLSVISGYTHLLERMTHRAADMTDQEQAAMRETHATLLAAVERLGVQLEALIDADAP